MKTLEEFNAHYKAVRARLNSGPPPKKPVKPEVIEPGLILVFPTQVRETEPTTIGGKGGDNIVFIKINETKIQKILREVSEKHGLASTMYRDKSRTKPFVLCRQEAAYRLSTEAKLSLTQIGRLFNNQDHTTVLNSINRYKERTK